MKDKTKPDEIRVCSYDLQALPACSELDRRTIYCSRACARKARNWRRRATRRGERS